MKVKLAVAGIAIAIAVYLVLLGRQGVELIRAGGVVPVVLGVAVLVLPFIGAWVVGTTLRAAFRHQHLAERIGAEGRELDTSGLPTMPSGRIERDAADELFAQVKNEWEQDPDDWRTNYRLARAYDTAGDRRRARDIMRRAVALEELDRGSRAGR